MRAKRIGITGATGFIGRELISRLLRRKLEISVFCRVGKHNFPKEIKIFKGDLATGVGVQKFVKDLDIVIHLAGRVLPPDEKIFEENVLSTYNLLESIKKPTKVIFNSSAAVYGSVTKKLDEQSKCMPDTIYGLSKKVCEEIVRHHQMKLGGKYIILRPFNIYGPGNRKGVIHSFYSSISKANKVVVTGNGRQKRDFLFIEDTVDAIIKAIDKNVSGVFNLATERSYSILELSKIFRKIMNRDFEINFTKDDDQKTGTLNLDTHLARNVLNWRPQTDLLTGLRKTIDWYEKNTSFNSL